MKPTSYTVTSTVTKRVKSFATVNELRRYLTRTLKRLCPSWTRDCFTDEELFQLWDGLPLLKQGDTIHWLRWTIAAL